MKKFLAFAVALLAVAFTFAGCASMTPAQGWTALIDGNAGMENWTTSGSTANWRAEDGAIQADKITAGKGASVLITKKNYRDLELYAEFWAADDTNSGIYVRAPDPNTVNTASGAYEIQIWDKNPARTTPRAASSTSPRRTQPTRPAAAGTLTRSTPRAPRSPSS